MHPFVNYIISSKTKKWWNKNTSGAAFHKHNEIKFLWRFCLRSHKSIHPSWESRYEWIKRDIHFGLDNDFDTYKLGRATSYAMLQIFRSQKLCFSHWATSRKNTDRITWTEKQSNCYQMGCFHWRPRYFDNLFQDLNGRLNELYYNTLWN